MIGKLILNLLEVNATTGFSAVAVDSDDNQVKVHHAVVPQGEQFPAVVYNEITLNPRYRHASAALNVQDDASYQLDVYHKNDFEAETIADHVRTALEEWSGVHDGKTYSLITLTARRKGFEQAFDLHRVSMDFQIRQAK